MSHLTDTGCACNCTAQQYDGNTGRGWTILKCVLLMPATLDDCQHHSHGDLSEAMYLGSRCFNAGFTTALKGCLKSACVACMPCLVLVCPLAAGQSNPPHGGSVYPATLLVSSDQDAQQRPTWMMKVKTTPLQLQKTKGAGSPLGHERGQGGVDGRLTAPHRDPLREKARGAALIRDGQTSEKGEVILRGVGTLRYLLILSENSACQVPICAVAA